MSYLSEVKFDIDANGIVNVTAKDLGTNKEQSITITSSTNLSDEEIEKMRKEAEENKEADKKRKEEADLKNEAEQLVFQTEKSLKDLGDKVDKKEKEEAEDLIKKYGAVVQAGKHMSATTVAEYLREKKYTNYKRKLWHLLLKFMKTFKKRAKQMLTIVKIHQIKKMM